MTDDKNKKESPPERVTLYVGKTVGPYGYPGLLRLDKPHPKSGIAQYFEPVEYVLASIEKLETARLAELIRGVTPAAYREDQRTIAELRAQIEALQGAPNRVASSSATASSFLHNPEADGPGWEEALADGRASTVPTQEQLSGKRKQ